MRIITIILIVCLCFPITAFSTENGFNFALLKEENNVSAVNISEYTESSVYHVEKIISTNYGTVLYFWPVGTPHGEKNPSLILIKEDGRKISLSEQVSREDLWHFPEYDNIQLSEDGKELTFSTFFDERSMGDLDGETIVLHDAGTYYYKSNLELGTTIETKFEPLDIISEEVISTWAKPEVEKAIELGIVPLSFRDNYKRNITRSEFAKIAMFFLSVQYGYSGVPAIQMWSPAEYNDNSFFPPEFINAYCSSKTDRNGNLFRDENSEEDYVYHNPNVEIRLSKSPFEDTVDCIDLPFVERAYHFGIVNGISETAFNPYGEITRQEAAAMLMRVYKNYAEYDSSSGKLNFSDDEQIAEWAKEDVYNVTKLGIMQGVSDDVFAPMDGYTIEQAIATFWRLYESAPISRKNKNIAPLLDYKFESEKFFDRASGTAYFHEESRTEYENFIVVYGSWSRRHTTELTYGLYVFDKYGGIACERTSTEKIKWDVCPDEKVLTAYINYGDTFRLYNKLNGAEKVYDKGTYKTEYDLENRKEINFERTE